MHAYTCLCAHTCNMTCVHYTSAHLLEEFTEITAEFNVHNVHVHSSEMPLYNRNSALPDHFPTTVLPGLFSFPRIRPTQQISPDQDRSYVRTSQLSLLETLCSVGWLIRI